MAEVTTIVKNIVANIDATILGEFNATSGKTDFCKTKWARIGKVVKDASEREYLITEKEVNTCLNADPQFTPGEPMDGLITLPAPFFLTGTKIAANNEWIQADTDLRKKTPLIWLLEIIREDHFGRGDVRDFETELRLFFLDETDPTQFNTEDHRREVVEPMAELAEAFLDVIRADRSFPRAVTDNYRLVTFSRFGVENENGVLQNILDANLSGVELQLTLAKYKDNCKC